MARKMTTANEQLFKKLKCLLPQDYQQIRPNLNYWINTNEIEKEWLKNVRFETDEMFQFGGFYQLAIAVFENNKYLVCSGLKPELSTSDFEYFKINSGLFCAAIIELNINPLVSESIGFELAENIFTPIEDITKKGVGYDLDKITKYFPEISIYKIHSKSPFFSLTPTLSRVGLFVATKCEILHHLDWSQAGLETVRVVSTIDVEIFPFELLVRAVNSRKWDHSFLEIYRSIEFLYPLPKINELKVELKLNVSSVEISGIIEDILGWHPIEEVALQKLFKNLPASLLNDFKTAFPNAENDGFDNRRAASLIYKLRNDCVHFRPIHMASSLRSKVNWKALLQAMLNAALFCYESQLTTSKEGN